MVTKLETLIHHPKSRNLLVVRAGLASLHSEWHKDGPCTWDLLVSAYHEDVPRNKASYFNYIEGPKWRPLWETINDNWIDLLDYEYFCFADDDLLAHAMDWTNAFLVCKNLALQLAQPALSANSFYSHAITLAHQGSSFRFTNFVEQMCPIFSREALLRCLPSMETNDRFAWGLDFVWPHLLANPVGRMGIIDAVQVQHTRPAGHNTSSDEAWLHCQRLLDRHRLDIPILQVHGQLAASALNGILSLGDSQNAAHV